MKKQEEKLEVIRGSGNIYKDFNYPDAEVRQLKAKVAAAIIRILDQPATSNGPSKRKPAQPMHR